MSTVRLNFCAWSAKNTQMVIAIVKFVILRHALRELRGSVGVRFRACLFITPEPVAVGGQRCGPARARLGREIM